MTSSPEAPHVAAALVALLGAAIGHAGPPELIDLLAGEYDNNEQIWQQGVDGEAPGSRRHWRFGNVGDGVVELSVGQGQTAPDEAAWTLTFSEDASGITAQTRGAAQCHYRWHATDTGYEGRVEAACPGLPEVLAIDDAGLTATWRTPTGVQVERARRSLPYTGWIALRRSHLDAAAGDGYVFVRDARWHDEGFLLPLLDGDQPTGYGVELARLTYQNTRAAVLKLGIVDTATGETIAYSWAEPGANRIGINLGWIQAGLTRAPDSEERAR